MGYESRRVVLDASFHGFGTQYNLTDQRGQSFRLFVSEQGIGREEGIFLFNGDDHTTGFPCLGGWMAWLRDFSETIGGPMWICAQVWKIRTVFETMDGNTAAWSVFLGPTPLKVLDR